MKETILITGGAGYIGSHMVRQLAAHGHKVIVFDNLSRGNADAVIDAELVVGDIGNSEELAAVFKNSDIDAVMHFAALAYVGESVHQPDIYYRNNVLGTLNLIDAMHAHGINNLIFSSTCATYGQPESLPITESTPQHPINPYGHSKLMVEQILKDYGDAFNFRSIALRYFNAAGCAVDGSLGERHDPETHLLPLILFEALRVRNGGDPEESTLNIFGSDFETHDGTCIRDYIHVSDLCTAHTAAYHRMLQKPELGAEQFNLGVNRGYSVLEVIEACKKITGIDIQFNTVTRRDGDPPELIADASAAMIKLQWKPEFPSIEHSLQHAWDWFSKNPPDNL